VSGWNTREHGRERLEIDLQHGRIDLRRAVGIRLDLDAAELVQVFEDAPSTR
jgi:hypothetical protein